MARLVLGDYPLYPSEALAVDESLLDDLVRAYAAARGPDSLEVTRFLFGFAPIRLFDRLLGDPVADLPAGGFVWVMHLSGWFGGVWLRSEIRSAQPQSMLANAGAPPGPEAFASIATRARDGIEAASGDDASVLAYVEKALPDLVAGFGYNQGYLVEIADAPPEGMARPKGFVSPRGPLWCDYGTPRLRALEALRSIAERIAAPPDARWRELAAPLPAKLETEIARGRQVWSSGLSVQGFDRRAYDQLLDVSGSFLEVIQACVLLACRAIAEDDVDSARRVALANACLAPWLGSYMLGLLDPSGDGGPSRLPVFAG